MKPDSRKADALHSSSEIISAEDAGMEGLPILLAEDKVVVLVNVERMKEVLQAEDSPATSVEAD